MSEASDKPSSGDTTTWSRPQSGTPAGQASPESAKHARDAHPLSSDHRQRSSSISTHAAAPATTTTPAIAADGVEDVHLSAHGAALPESQPMVSTSSSSSARSVKDAAAAAAAPASGTASPYGTRSRNRTTGARPNYAEDKDLDLDFDYVRSNSAKKSNPATKPARSGENVLNDVVGPSTSDRASGVNTRRAAAAQTGPSTSTTAVNGGSANAAKDQIPGTSTFSAATGSSVTAPPSKKRKAAGASTTTSSQAPASSSTQTTSRRTNARAGAPSGGKASNMLTFELSQAYLKYGKLKADDGTVLNVDDHVYLICEPPGEPYYLARIMEFLHANNDRTQPVDSIRVNWYYRPRDIQRKLADTRCVFASMHSDTCPLTSLRGKCRIWHRSDVQDLDDYRKTADCFWFDKLFDRYSHRYYEVIPTKQVINVPVKVKKVLDERWTYIIVEVGRGKELTSAVKSCKRCGGYCASNDSVECAVCRSTYHMNCVRPPLLKKPSRGFAWACGPCSRAQEKKLEARNTPILNKNADADEEEVLDEDEEDAAAGQEIGADDFTPADSPGQDSTIHPATAEQAAHAKLWPYRYLGIHCRVEDALDYDDRIYPRASSRLGPRHQANVPAWPGRPFELVKPVPVKRKYLKGGGYKKEAKLAKETMAALEAEKAAKEKRQRWVMDEPPGYVRRGDDHGTKDPENTARLLFRMTEVGEADSQTSRGGDDDEDLQTTKLEAREKLIDDYMSQARLLAKEVGVKEYSTNFLDKALEILHRNNFAVRSALEDLRSINRKVDLKEPELTKEEQKRFEEGVTKYGSELHSVARHVKTQKEANIVRYYYMWKKTERGKQVWGNYEGRKGKKEAKRADASSSKLVDDVADDVDDSAFDNGKATERKRGFQCKFCLSMSSKQWRRAPGVSPGTTVRIESNAKEKGKEKGAQYVLALCQRCAELWRRYGIQWEDLDEATKRASQASAKGYKRKLDEDLLKEVPLDEPGAAPQDKVAQPSKPSPGGKEAAATAQTGAVAPEPAKKKLKTEKEDKQGPPSATNAAASATAAAPKKKPVEKPPEKPVVPEMPKPKAMICAVCLRMSPDDTRVVCRECRMTVHRGCYGVVGDMRSPGKWVCDPCSNDKNPQVSTSYECVLCPVRSNEHNFVRPVQNPHRKSLKEQKAEHDMNKEAAEFYRRKQIEMNRPADPREPLKRTAGNNWVHVTCAIWVPEIKFGNAKALEPSEGFGTIPASRFEQTCTVCKKRGGACVNCFQCHAPYHVACAAKHIDFFGFDITPVKSSRRDLVNTVSLGNESGLMTAQVWCREHDLRTICHNINKVHESGLNALQLFARTYKQADLALTGTSRKANLVNQSTKASNQGTSPISANRRASHANALNGSGGPAAGSHPTRRTSTKVEEPDGNDEALGGEGERKTDPNKRRCVNCNIDVSPKWWKVDRSSVPPYARLETPSARPRHSGMAGGPYMPNGYGPNGDSHYGGIDGPHTMPSHQPSPVMYPKGRASGRDLLDDPAALAAAALTTGAHNEPSTAARFQCHKCHWKRLREPSPPKAMEWNPPPPPPYSAPAPAPSPARNLGPGWQHVPPPPPGPPSSHYHGWSQPPNGPAGAPAGPSMNGAPPHHAPVMTHSHSLNNRGPPAQMNGLGSSPRGQPAHPPRPRGTPPPPPPPMHHVNGSAGPPTTLPPPPPQHHSHPHPPSMMHASPQPHFSSLQHQPHPGSGGHLPRMTDGSPYPHPHLSPLQHPAMYAAVEHQHHSPRLPRDRPSTPRDHAAPPAAPQPHNRSRSGSEVRPLGGASASPSLRNLLS